SLFSPMFEFADNNAAMETAQAVINELMNIENIETGDINSNQIENIWNGTEEHPNRVKDDSAISQPTEGVKATSARRHNLKENLAEKMNKPVSRRQLLRGAIMLEKHDADKINPGCK
ncbi:MAG TPA: [NiFe]-hydrogenase assembly, chaperone, HybE, partial [Thiotrichales bacterium]|nr:[NiFe]-hydrogenase assembly, chaperone, HybE [Thiotrichales bacterium]